MVLYQKRVKLKKKRLASFQGCYKKNEMTRGKLKKNKRRMNEKKKTTKTKRRRISVGDSLDHPVSCSLFVDDDLVVCQILSRVPVKSLMRFKCVCKRWRSIIEEDSHFISLHLSRSETQPSLFILLQENAEFLKMYRESFLSAGLHINGRDANIHTLRKIKSFPYRQILGPFGGLICFVNDFAVRIYNVSTREVTPWIYSTVFENLETNKGIVDAFESRPNCSFGFDCTTKKHKVIFMWCVDKFKNSPVCEVLTVGDNTWRVIDDIPPYLDIGSATVSANGSIYWNLFRHFDGRRIGIRSRLVGFDSEGVESSDDEEDYTDWIMAFDIGSEKFRMIPVPLDPKSKHDVSFYFNKFSLSVVDGCLAIIRRTHRKLTMWIFRDHNKENETSITTSSEKYWTQLSIQFPSEFIIALRRSEIYVHSISGTDQILLETYSHMHDYGERNVMAANYYYYNQKKKTLRKLEINGISSIPEDCRAKCSTFIETLLPVRKKL